MHLAYADPRYFLQRLSPPQRKTRYTDPGVLLYAPFGAQESATTGLEGVAEVMQRLFGDVQLAPPAALLTAEEGR